jgi:hypothetical protein
MTVGSGKNRGVLSAPFASLIAGQEYSSPGVVLNRKLHDGAAQVSDSRRFCPVVLSDRSTRRGLRGLSVGGSVRAPQSPVRLSRGMSIQDQLHAISKANEAHKRYGSRRYMTTAVREVCVVMRQRRTAPALSRADQRRRDVAREQQRFEPQRTQRSPRNRNSRKGYPDVGCLVPFLRALRALRGSTCLCCRSVSTGRAAWWRSARTLVSYP